MFKQLFAHALEEFRSTDISRVQLRKFGYLVGSICMAIGGYFFWLDSSLVVFAIGVILVVSGLLVPKALHAPYRLWMGLAVILGFFVGNAVLVALYYLVVTPIGLIRRMLGSDPLERVFDDAARTYWKPYERRKPAHMRRPF